MTDRPCGECTLCCTAAYIPELQKAPGVPCSYLVDGECSIYATRPVACRKYRCLWLSSGKFSHMLRPDQCSIIFDVVPHEKTIIATPADPARPYAWREGPAAELIQRYHAIGFSVLIAGAERHAFIAEGQTFEHVWGGIIRAAKAMGVLP